MNMTSTLPYPTIDFDLYVEIENCAKYSPIQVNAVGPTFARIRVNQEFLDVIERKQTFCRVEDQHLSAGQSNNEIHSLWDMAPQCDEVEDWDFIVSSTSFRIEGHTSSAPVVEFVGMGIKFLKFWLEDKGSPHQDPHRRPSIGIFSWYGNSLFYSRDDAEKHLANVLEKHPEITARQVELEMMRRIQGAGLGPESGNDAGGVAQRRRKVVV